MTQVERIEKYINEFGSITQLEAQRDLGISYLPARVYDMKKDGYVFYQKIEKSKNRWGEPVSYLRYAFKQENLEKKSQKSINILKFIKTLKKGI